MVLDGANARTKHVPYRDSRLTFLLQVLKVSNYRSPKFYITWYTYFINNTGLTGWKLENNDNR